MPKLQVLVQKKLYREMLDMTRQMRPITRFGSSRTEALPNEKTWKRFHSAAYHVWFVLLSLERWLTAAAYFAYPCWSWNKRWLLTLQVCLRSLFKTHSLIVLERGEDHARKRFEKRAHSFVVRRDNSDHVSPWKDKDKLTASAATCDALCFCFTNLSVVLPKKETVRVRLWWLA